MNAWAGSWTVGLHAKIKVGPQCFTFENSRRVKNRSHRDICKRFENNYCARW